MCPNIPISEKYDAIKLDPEIDDKSKEILFNWLKNIESKHIFLEKINAGQTVYNEVGNLHLSQCYNCHKIAVWIHKNMIFPSLDLSMPPNPDTPEEILNDYEEARRIVSLSPRGAAALLRLCVQKLCKFLGEKGQNIDDDIASLVSKGLNPLVQQSLDIVRVIGNEAVHPGVIDLKDDQKTVYKLFQIINLIVQQMISTPNNIQQMYSELPEKKREAIKLRNERANRNNI